MSVIVYKDGEQELIEPEQLEQSLAVGWSLTPDAEPRVYLDDTATEPELESSPDPDATGTTNEEIRLLAQQAGLDNWQTAKIKTLKAALGLE